MDLLTVGLSAIISTFCTICLMIIFYRFWILPYLTRLTESVPIQCKTLIGPYVDEKLTEVRNMISEQVSTVSETVRKSSARFQRTVNQAAAALDLGEIDLETEEGQEAATAQLSKRYGVDVAVQAVSQILQSIAANRERKGANGGTTEKEPVKW